MQDYLQTQKQKELTFRRQDLEKAVAALEDREAAGLTSLEDVEAHLASLREQAQEEATQAKDALGESLLAMARPGSSYAALEDNVRAGDFEVNILTGELQERHRAYVKLCQGAFQDLQVQLQKINFDGIRSELHLDSMGRFLAASDWLQASLQAYLDLTTQLAARRKSLATTSTNLQKREKKALLNIKDLADKSLGSGDKHLVRLTAPNQELTKVRAELVSTRLQTQLILAQETNSIDNLLADLDRAAGEIHLAATQAQATSRQLELLIHADFETATQLESLLSDMLADFDPTLLNFLTGEVSARLIEDAITTDQRRSFLDLLKEQRVFHHQLLDVYSQTLDQLRQTAGRVLIARRDFGKDVLTFYSSQNN